MDRFQKQSILIVIQTLESQLAALRSLIGLTDTMSKDKRYPGSDKPVDSSPYTTDEEDAEIDAALKMEDQKDEMLQDIFRQAQIIPEG
jgi:hypothetical protein